MRYALQIPPGVVSDDTAQAKAGRWSDGDRVRFVRGRPELIGGHERVFRSQLEGVCRGSLAWYDNDGALNLAFGTNSHLYVWKGGQLTDITPTLALPPIVLGANIIWGANPLEVTNGSPVVKVKHRDHGLATGETVVVSGAVAIGGITPNGGPFAITRLDDDSYSFTFTSSATASVAAGGGDAVKIAPQRAFAPGQVNGTGGRGYGTGAYGVGGYGQPSDTEYFPRTWSFGFLGAALVASPRGGTIYMWENDPAQRAAPLLNAPRQCTGMVTTAERVVMALGCNQEDGKGFNIRCVRHSDPRDETVWNTDSDTLAREKILEGAGRIVAGRDAGFGVFIHTDSDLWDARYAGALDEVYSFTRLGRNCGLIGPMASTVKDQRAFWMTLDFRFMTCSLGGEPAAIECPHRDELEENLAPVQRDKIVASTLSGRAECWFFYPDRRDGLENSRALFVSTEEGWWSKAKLARTAFVDASPALYPLGVDPQGRVYWHERGQSADGAALAWALESAPQYINSGEELVYLRAFYPDFKDQKGAIRLTIITREHAQATPEEHGPFIVPPGEEVIDLDVVARLVSFSLAGESSPAQFRAGSFIFEGRAAGRR